MIPPAMETVLSILLVIGMVVGCCNATNLMDGLDGLCGGVTAVMAAGFLFLAVHLATFGDDPLPTNLNAVRIVLALALLGAVLGFVPYNFNPASIFMGDAGSMFLGYACATMILLLMQTQDGFKWLLAALVMFSLPVLDTALAFARRWVNDRPLFSADRHHFHHQLVARGFTVRKTVLISYALAIGFVVLGGFVAYMRLRYAVAFYMVIFGSIIVAAYKMGMVHERRATLETEAESVPESRDSVINENATNAAAFALAQEKALEIRAAKPSLGSGSLAGSSARSAPNAPGNL
jgi:UDP-GlcNAc:undecaprenyl-phosphate GlcNAc-1-phosphate transferase